MLSRSLRAVAGPSRSYVCLFCVSRNFERSFFSFGFRKDAVTDDSNSGQKTDLLVNSIPPNLGNGKSSNASVIEEHLSTDISSDGAPCKDDGKKPKTKKKKPSKSHKKSATKDKSESATKTATKSKTQKKKVANRSITKTDVKIVGRRVKAKKPLIRKVNSKAPDGTDLKIADDAPTFESSGHEGESELAGLHGEVQTQSGILEPSEEKIEALNAISAAVPTLAYGLDRVLFNPGVYHLRDPRSRVYNFDPYLSSIMPVSEFDFEALGDYITSSRDVILRDMAHKHRKRFIGSSSSMTSVLSHFHFLLSAWRPLDMDSISQGFSEKLRSFTRLTRAPAAVFLRYKDGVYAIDADKEFDTANILMNLGKSMEKLLTMPMNEYERYRRTNGERTPLDEAAPETYHYSTCGDFLMRAQLDAYDPRLPGTGMFDLKTRAVVSIRMDAKNFNRGLGYEIKSRFGNFESFEREYFDMARSAFLKYSLQARVGRMDGIFVAFHNIERIFGFQYLSLPEIDKALHGQEDTALGDAEFMHSMTLWNRILNTATTQFPDQSLRFYFETRTGVLPFMYIFAEPVTEDEIDAIQTSNQEKIDAIQKKLLYPELCEELDDESMKEEIATPEETEPSEEASTADDETKQSDSEDTPGRPLLGMCLHTYSKVNGNSVTRPTNFKANDKWVIEYKLATLPAARARALFKACQKRREKQFADVEISESDFYRQKLWEMSKRGREWRKTEDELDQKQGIVALNKSNN
ncbi:hypothetical protein PRK78_007480 [Emydomyces testavorans]|uniref:Uncharacterized protein n=1 Tax=Emydomyces testavorans TaxID=2070801 RepID=A0AAF0DNA4_9EURO|nr:hypothetical protein PRK78_007480 [Emydomyces testavorans]